MNIDLIFNPSPILTITCRFFFLSKYSEKLFDKKASFFWYNDNENKINFYLSLPSRQSCVFIPKRGIRAAKATTSFLSVWQSVLLPIVSFLIKSEKKKLTFIYTSSLTLDIKLKSWENFSWWNNFECSSDLLRHILTWENLQHGLIDIYIFSYQCVTILS